MSLIVEDGTVVAGAESYSSVADADTYHAARGTSSWNGMSTTEKEQALRRASDYMTQTYRTSLKGVRVSYLQTLDWPRYNVRLNDVGFANQAVYVSASIVPLEIKNACAELALIAAAGPLKSNLKQNILSKKVGPLTVDYDQYSPQYSRYQTVDAYMAIYINSGSNGVVFKLTRT